MGIQKTKPLIGQVTMEQELNNLLEKANETWGVYEEALNVTKELEGANAGLEEESKALSAQLASEQGNLSQYQDRQAKAAALKVKVEAELAQGQSSSPCVRTRGSTLPLPGRTWM